jgi:ribosomal protein L30/L7E
MADSVQQVKKILGKETKVEAPKPAKQEQKGTMHEVKEQLAKLPKKDVVKNASGISGPLIAAVLIRGRDIGLRHDVVRTMDKLKLQRRHICVVYQDSQTIRGMMGKCKDQITYGPISEEIFKKLHEKRGSLKNREGKLLNVFRMHPPRGGYGHKGIKVSYQEGGCLGLRRKGMDAFLEKMM